MGEKGREEKKRGTKRGTNHKTREKKKGKVVGEMSPGKTTEKKDSQAKGEQKGGAGRSERREPLAPTSKRRGNEGSVTPGGLTPPEYGENGRGKITPDHKSLNYLEGKT